MTRRILRTCLLAFASLVLAAGNAAARDCAERLQVETSPLSFGTVSVPQHGSGVVVLDPGGGVATVGRLSGGIDAQPAWVRVCGPADTEFRLTIAMGDPSSAGAAGHGLVVTDLTLRPAGGGSIQRIGEDQWRGRLGRSGLLELQIGGTIRIERGPADRELTLPVHVTVSSED